MRRSWPWREGHPSPRGVEAQAARAEANGAVLYQRKVLDGYGHLDTFMGSTASRDTYPVILQALDAQA